MPAENLDHLVDQPSKMPTPKWLAGVGTGGAALVLVTIADLVHVELSPEAAGALVLAAGAVAAWLKRNHAVVDRMVHQAGELAEDCLDSGGGAHYDRNGDGRADHG